MPPIPTFPPAGGRERVSATIRGSMCEKGVRHLCENGAPDYRGPRLERRGSRPGAYLKNRRVFWPNAPWITWGLNTRGTCPVTAKSYRAVAKMPFSAAEIIARTNQ